MTSRLRSILFRFRKSRNELPDNCYVKSALPYELIEAIVREAWTATDIQTRWQLFRAISTLSRLWRAVLIDVALRHVFFESTLDLMAYRSLIARHLILNGAEIGDDFHRSFAKHICVSLSIDSVSKPFEVSQVAELIPNARFISLSILVDRRYLFSSIVPHLLTDRPSLTHLRLCWPPLERSYSCSMPSAVVTSVTHLHIPRHPYASLNAVLALFPFVTHLRLGTPCFLKNLVPYMAAVQVLVLDSPPNYNTHTSNGIAGRAFPSSVPLWNVWDALEYGLLRTQKAIRTRLIINAGVDDSDEHTVHELAMSCRDRGIQFECRRVYDAYHLKSVSEVDRWNFGAWL
ncbi:hypothetical protein BJ138DRAFT_1143152 [Hygrophoropsis aurantiaca]|uniref:Uncharacterized protein n=1 Tax=Hygrophoropsis aurantiaca TaxID=72124 RepID=A0ACB8AMN7_9AGAM|nr:hypothetical protein BJ138DRAFT_1143152 [Hygrophoropsis aurantiaca]